MAVLDFNRNRLQPATKRCSWINTIFPVVAVNIGRQRAPVTIVVPAPVSVPTRCSYPYPCQHPYQLPQSPPHPPTYHEATRLLFSFNRDHPRLVFISIATDAAFERVQQYRRYTLTLMFGVTTSLW